VIFVECIFFLGSNLTLYDSVFILILAFVALIFSLTVALSCDFVEVVLSENSPESLTSSNLTSLSLGQYRYNPNGEGCQSLRQNNIDISWDFITGQIGLLVAVVCAVVVIMLLLIEATCCRFPCSRCIISTCFVLAVIGMAMTFLTYASSVWYVH
jgi:ABC-type transport system involved in multi-copper enzyme maturation permease subunit